MEKTTIVFGYLNQLNCLSGGGGGAAGSGESQNIPTLLLLMMLLTSFSTAIFASGLSLAADVKKDRIKFMDVLMLESKSIKEGVVTELCDICINISAM